MKNRRFLDNERLRSAALTLGIVFAVLMFFCAAAGMARAAEDMDSSTPTYQTFERQALKLNSLNGITETSSAVIDNIQLKKAAAQTGLPDAYGDKVSKIKVTKSWADGTDPADSITAEVKSEDGTDTQTVTLSSSNDWTATVDVDSSKTYNVIETKVTKDNKDVTDQYTAEVKKGDEQISTARGRVATKGTTTTPYTITNTKKSTGSTGETKEPDTPSKSAEGLKLTKEVDKQGQAVSPSDNVKLTLEAQSTGNTVSVEKKGPADILLVLDNTTSMTAPFGSGTRLSAMKAAAENFVDGLNETSGSRIAMCSFVTGNYNSPTTNDVAWTPLNSNSKSRVKTAIEGLNAPDDGYDTVFLTPINYVVDNMLDGSNPKYVVFFTDGDDNSDSASLTTAINNLHSKADAVYSVAISSARYATDDVDAWKTKAKSIASKEEYYYDVENISDMNTAFNSALSSITEKTSTSNTTLDASAVFKDVVNTDKFDVSDATATVSIYDYADGTWNALSDASISTNAGSSGTLNSWTGKSSNDGMLTIKFDKDTGAVTVTGFSYKDHYLSASGINAQKLHVEISGLKLKSGAQTAAAQTGVHTNKDSDSGIYQSSTSDSPVANFPQPTVNIPAKTVEKTRLTIKHQISGDNPDTDREFSYTAKITPDGGETTTQTFTLKHNGTYDLNDIPLGANIVISQAEDNDYYLSKIDESNGINDTGTIDFASRKYTVKVPKTAETVTFTNAKNETHADAATGNDSVTVHKTVSKADGGNDNEFTVNLAVDTRTNVAKYYTKYFKEMAEYGATEPPSKDMAIGDVYDSLGGNDKIKVSTKPVGKGNSATFTIYASDRKTVLVSGLTLHCIGVRRITSVSTPICRTIRNCFWRRQLRIIQMITFVICLKKLKK